MKTAIPYRNEGVTIYPGLYCPPATKGMDSSVAERLLTREPEACINISECKDYYKVEMLAPGHAKEDFFIDVSNGMLTVVVLDSQQSNEGEEYTQHDFNYQYFRHAMQLPPYIDPDFVSAEYKAGILSLYFTKTERNVDNIVHSVVVY
jgi:HSP20 family molecular chaperone IbpA